MEEAKTLVGQQFALSVEIAHGKAIQINGVFMKDDDEAAINRQLDKLWNAVERLEAKSKLEEKRLNLIQAHKNYRDVEDLYRKSFDKAEKITRDGKIVPDAIRIEAENNITSLEVTKKAIAQLEAEIKVYSERVGNGLESR
jgi:hypothetical protein